MISRACRTFMIQTAGLCAAFAVAQRAQAGAPLVEENDPAAKGLGYRAKAVSADGWCNVYAKRA